MKCEEIQEVLADYLGDELDASCTVALERHLGTCPSCRREVESLAPA